MIRIAVFASGGGTNLQALLDRFNGAGHRFARVALVVSDREGAGALERAARAGVPGQVVRAAGREPEELARETLEVLQAHDIDMVALAGYLRLVPAPVVQHYRNRMLNIHPALLPAFGGKGMYGRRVHEAVLAARCRITGPTVHLVDERYDTGPIVIQWPVPVLADDTPDTLAARVLRVEHAIYPPAVELIAEALHLGTGVLPFGLDDPVAFSMVRTPAPSEADVRRALGFR